MTPLDTLRAALELVEQQLAAATPGPWRQGLGLGSITVRAINEERTPVAYETTPADATLIVTGVALLPVVRDILADAIRYREQNLPGTGAALRLARAIVKDSDLT